MERLRYSQGITIQPFCNQIEMHLYNQNQPLREYLASRNIFIEAFSPLGSSPENRIDKDPIIMMSEITIPSSVTSIGNDAFNGCSSMSEIIESIITEDPIYSDISSSSNCRRF